MSMRDRLAAIRYRLKRMLRWLHDLLFVPVCRCCGKRQSIFVSTPILPLCQGCLAQWGEQTKKLCDTCALPYTKCRCMPKRLSKGGARALVKLAVYRRDCAGVVSSLVLRAKDVNDRDVFRFLASELLMPTFTALRECGIDPKDAVITYAPRGRKAYHRTGHDQARQLSRYLAKRLGCAHMRTVRRRRGGEQQKDLSVASRVKNAAGSFYLGRGVRVRDRAVVLIDDICTSGATQASCSDLLYGAGASDVLCVCLAQTQGGALVRPATPGPEA